MLVTLMLMRIQMLLVTFDADADPDAACHFVADPDPDPTFHFELDADTSFQ